MLSLLSSSVCTAQSKKGRLFPLTSSTVCYCSQHLYDLWRLPVPCSDVGPHAWNSVYEQVLWRSSGSALNFFHVEVGHSCAHWWDQGPAVLLSVITFTRLEVGGHQRSMKAQMWSGMKFVLLNIVSSCTILHHLDHFLKGNAYSDVTSWETIVWSGPVLSVSPCRWNPMSFWCDIECYWPKELESQLSAWICYRSLCILGWNTSSCLRYST